MNIKITEQEHLFLCENAKYIEYTVGSDLWGTRTDESDTDILRIYRRWWDDDDDVFLDIFPNIHPFQYDGENTDYLWTEQKQFMRNITSGDSTLNAEAFIFAKEFPADMDGDALDFVRTYKIIKNFLGVAKRDLKRYNPAHPSRDSDKRGFHAARGIYIAESLIRGVLPSLECVKELPAGLPSKSDMELYTASLRLLANEQHEKGSLPSYFVDETDDTLLTKMLAANNTKEFKYD